MMPNFRSPHLLVSLPLLLVALSTPTYGQDDSSTIPEFTDTATTPKHGYKMYWTDDEPYSFTDSSGACIISDGDDVPAGADDDYVPRSLVQLIMDAMDTNDEFVVGTPSGYHDGFVQENFTLGDFRDPNNFWNYCRDEEDCGSLAHANTSYIEYVAPKAICTSDSHNTRTAGHELFHHVQFTADPRWSRWTKALLEGTADAVGDNIYSEQDADPDGRFGQLVRKLYRDLHANMLFSSDTAYDAALFWKYAGEQYGIDSSPELGTDPASADTDGDGVNDNLDSCQGTAADASVDADGCSAEQLASASGYAADRVMSSAPKRVIEMKGSESTPTPSISESSDYRGDVAGGFNLAQLSQPLLLRGDMNDWGTDLAFEAQMDGTHTLTLDLVPGTYGFKIATADWAEADLGAVGVSYELVLGESIDIAPSRELVLLTVKSPGRYDLRLTQPVGSKVLLFIDKGDIE